MSNLPSSSHEFLTEQLETFSHNAHTPFSKVATSALVLLEDGAWIPGVRIESASYPLTIPALLNAYTTFMTFRRDRVAAFAMNRPFTPEELLLAARLSGRPLKAVGEGFLVDESVPFPKPAPAPLLPLIEGKSVGTPREGIELAQALTEHAFVPESDFPVGCILETTSGKLIPGVNVENADWSRILCAERNALGTAWTYGFNNIKNLYLTCTKDSQCSPCGACRQLLAELTPAATLWMDRGSDPEQHSTPELLLPASFTGQALFNHS